MAASQAAIKAQAKWDKEHTKSFCIKLNLETDKDIVQALLSVPNKQEYIKQALRAYNQTKKEGDQ